MPLPLFRLSPFDRLLSVIERSRTSDRWLLRVAFFAVIATGIAFLLAINSSYTTLVPSRGGTLTEGIIGTPRFVNPVLANTRADRDVSALVYSGLMRLAPDGELVPDVAESVTVSEDGLVYNVVLRRDIRFHDGTPLTSRDVAYTINLIQDPELRSPLRGNWTDVAVEVLGEYELNILLSEPYAAFLENFTVGILPHHIWSRLTTEQVPLAQFNMDPIGTGPFTVAHVRRNKDGIIDRYTLTPHTDHPREPNLRRITLHFYPNEVALADAFADGEIMSTTQLPVEAAAVLPPEEATIIEAPLPRIFGIFFNQNRSPALRDSAAREALSVGLDRGAIIEAAAAGFGVPTSNPILFSPETVSSTEASTPLSATSTPLQQAAAVLEAGGWTQTDLDLWEKPIDGTDATLRVVLRTSNGPLFETIAQEVATQWRALGVEVEIEQYEQAGLVQSVIRTRDFQSLLFGHDLNRTHDLYPFWHSSQQDDPGLNVAQYANITVDELLDEARATKEEGVRRELTAEAAAIIAAEAPAVFLFAPSFVYVTDPALSTAPMEQLGAPADRFANIEQWYLTTRAVWPWFTH